MAYSDTEKTEIINKVCERIESGASLRTACDREGIPRKTFFQWIDKDKSKSNQYARAVNERAEYLAEDLIDLVEKRDDIVYSDESGKLRTDAVLVQAKRLEVDTKKWIVSKLFPKKYGDKIGLETDESLNIITVKPKNAE